MLDVPCLGAADVGLTLRDELKEKGFIVAHVQVPLCVAHQLGLTAALGCEKAKTIISL